MFIKSVVARSRLFLIGLCVLLFSLGAYLRFINLSPYFIYPDTYQNILVAENIRDYGSVVGRLGADGQVWPSYFGWTRPGFSLLILIGNFFTHDLFSSASSVIFISSVFALVFVYFYIFSLFQSRFISLSAVFLLSLSFNHSIWSGFVLTESLGVLCLVILLWSLFRNAQKVSSLAEIRDLVLGLLFGWAVLVRYEYVLLFIPFVLYIFFKSPKPWITLLNFSVAVFFVLAITFSRLFPVVASVRGLLAQNYLLLVFGGIVLVVGVVFVFLCLRLSESFRYFLLRKSALAVIFFALIFSLLLLLQLIFPAFFRLGYFELTAPREFFESDVLLGIFSLIGFFVLYRVYRRYELVLFVFCSCMLLGFSYYKVNPEMQRYWTHLIPFFLIPAGVGLEYFMRKFIYEPFRLQHNRLRASGSLLLLTFLAFYQFRMTYEGLRTWSGGEYFMTSYSQEAARVVKKYARREDILLVSFPESYYAHIGLSTHSLAAKAPYIYIPDELNDRDVLVVDDMGMQEHFPEFISLVRERLSAFKVGEEKIGRNYHFAMRSTKEGRGVGIYRVKLERLREIIK